MDGCVCVCKTGRKRTISNSRLLYICNISYVNAFYACCLLFGADFGNGAFVYFLLYWVMNVGNYYRFRSPRLSAFAWNAAISIHILSTISDAHSHTHIVHSSSIMSIIVSANNLHQKICACSMSELISLVLSHEHFLWFWHLKNVFLLSREDSCTC